MPEPKEWVRARIFDFGLVTANSESHPSGNYNKVLLGP